MRHPRHRPDRSAVSITTAMRSGPRPLTRLPTDIPPGASAVIRRLRGPLEEWAGLIQREEDRRRRRGAPTWGGGWALNRRAPGGYTARPPANCRALGFQGPFYERPSLSCRIDGEARGGMATGWWRVLPRIVGGAPYHWTPGGVRALIAAVQRGAWPRRCGAEREWDDPPDLESALWDVLRSVQGAISDIKRVMSRRRMAVQYRQCGRP